MTDTQPPVPEQEPAADRAAALGESRGHRAARHFHGVRLYTGAIAFVALLAVLIVLISANTRNVKLSWAFGSTHASLVWIILATAVIGWLLGITTAVVFRLRTRRPR
ncbi:MAG: hypothetical protein ACXVRV_14515 [Gaiellaceae bacterium]